MTVDFREEARDVARTVGAGSFTSIVPDIYESIQVSFAYLSISPDTYGPVLTPSYNGWNVEGN